MYYDKKIARKGVRIKDTMADLQLALKGIYKFPSSLARWCAI